MLMFCIRDIHSMVDDNGHEELRSLVIQDDLLSHD